MLVLKERNIFFQVGNVLLYCTVSADSSLYLLEYFYSSEEYIFPTASENITYLNSI